MLAAALALMAARAGAQTATGALLLGAPLPRAASFGGAQTAVFGDEASVFVNPAGLAPIRRLAIGASAETAPDRSRLGAAAGALRVGRFTLGFGIAGLEPAGDSIPLETAYHVMGVGAIAYRRGMISLGVNLKGLREYLSDGSAPASTATAVTGNAGIGIAVFDIAALGFVIENVGGTFHATAARPSLPRTVRGGFAINFVDPQGTARMFTALEWIRPPGGDAYWVLAAETGAVHRGFGVLGRMAVTAGRGPTDQRDASFGGGLVLKSVRIDYATQGFHSSERRTHRLGIRFSR